jgi:hypothetical protein
VLAGIVLLIVGVLMTFFGAIFLLVGAAGAELLSDVDPSLGDDAGAIAAVLTVIALVLLILGIAQIVSAIGVFVHKSWGRWIGVVTGSIGLVFGFLILAGSFMAPASSGDMIIGLIWLAAHGFVVAALAATGEHFRQVFPGR